MKRLICSIMALIMCFSFSTTAYAQTTTTQEQAEPYASGLLSSGSVSISKYDTMYLKITVTTDATYTYYQVGYKNLKIQRYIDGNWKTYTTMDDSFSYNTGAFSKTVYSVKLPSGYKYRVALTHYVKKTNSIFSSSQSLNNTSDFVTISY